MIAEHKVWCAGKGWHSGIFLHFKGFTQCVDDWLLGSVPGAWNGKMREANRLTLRVGFGPGFHFPN